MSANCRVRAEALDAYLHGMLNEAQQRELNAHLLVCPQCNRTLASLEAETYTLSKGLRNVPAPPMSVSAADLVVRHAGQQSPGGTVELTEREIAELEKAHRSSSKKDSSVIRLANKAAVTTTHAVSFVHRRGLLKVAAIAFGAGLVIWYSVATARKIDTLQNAIDDLVAHDRSQEAARLRHEHDQALQMQQTITSLNEEFSRRMARDQTRQQVENIGRLDKLTAALSDVQHGIESEISKYRTQVVNLTLTHEQQEQDRIAHEARSKALEEQLETVKRNLDALRDKGDGQEPALAEVEFKELRLIPERGIEIGFDKAADIMSSQPLVSKGGNIGWSLALGSARLNSAIVVPGPGKVPGLGIESSSHPILTRADPQRCAAPTVQNGKVFIGNGLADGDIVAFDGATGKQLWSYAVRETVGAPVVSEEGGVYFCTDRGTLYALAQNQSKLGVQYVWSKFVGAVTTQPALDEKCIFVVHKTEYAGKPAGALGFRYSLTCLKADSGYVNWTRALNDDAISSPVAYDGHVFITTRDGNLTVYDYAGKYISTTPVSATCAPVAAGDSLYFSSWEAHPRFGFNESIQKLSLDSTVKGKESVAGPFKATYFILMPPGVSMSQESSYENGLSPEDQMLSHTPASEWNALPVMHEAWTYMGARPTIVEQNAYVAIGDKLVCWDLKANKAKWSCQISGSSDGTTAIGQGQPPLTPPAYASGKLYLGSIWGDMLCVDAASGKQTWRYRFDGSKGISSQVMLDQGRAYATTGNGMLLSIDTGDQTATGWHSWGGSAGHSGVRTIK